MSDPTPKQVETYMRTHGKHAEMTLKMLGKDLAFVQAINSSIGQEILRDDIDRLETLLEQIYNETISPADMAEFRHLKRRIAKITERLNNYTKRQQEIVSNGSKKTA